MSHTTRAISIAPTDRVSDVLARDESLVDVFVRYAPHFAKLRNRAMRRVMARLVTVEQAARTAGVPVEILLRDLNAALDAPVSASHGAHAIDGPPAEPAPAAGPRSIADAVKLRHPPNAPIVDLDVCDDLRVGREPFSRIMAAVGALHAEDVLHLRAIFEPVPLFSVMERRGFVHESRENAPGDWSVWFWRREAERAPAPTTAPGESTGGEAPPLPAAQDYAENASLHWLDVRGLEPPEPLLRTLAALDDLPDGHTLIQVNVRVPQFLIPMLGERGYACEIDESHADRVLVRIWRAS
jgi:uncharacterized protein (DUF2249 family)